MTSRFPRVLLFLLFFHPGYTQKPYYFPDRNAIWEEKFPGDVAMDADKLEAAVTFALQNEYSGSRDLRIAILKCFEREPYHEIQKEGRPGRPDPERRICYS